jgi:glycosidase
VSHPLLYEINTRCWLAELSSRAGRRLTLAEVPDSEFEFWERCGFTHIWLMGVWYVGKRSAAHSGQIFAAHRSEFEGCEVAGSPYAIAGYDVSRKLGGKTALATFRRKLNERGMKLLLDFIPNHTALDHPWVEAHPEFYVTSSFPRKHTVALHRHATTWFAHGHCGFGEPWVDTLQLDYRNPHLRRAMIGELLAVSAQCDGVRCDMAMLALRDVFLRTWKEFPSAHYHAQKEFWTEAIAAVRAQRNGFVSLAEVYWNLEARLQELGFDFTYDKALYDRIVGRNAVQFLPLPPAPPSPGGSVVRGEYSDGGRGTLFEVTNYLHSLTPAFLERSAHFIENHDEPRIASLLSPEEHRAAALLVAALPGMRFLHEGQLSGRRLHANVHFATRREEAIDPHTTAFYERLFSALKNSAVGDGAWQLIDARPAWSDNPTHENIALIQWQKAPRTFDLAVVNLSSVQSQCYAPLSIDGLAKTNWRMVDLLGSEVYEREGRTLRERGLYLDLRPHAAQLFHFEPAS